MFEELIASTQDLRPIFQQIFLMVFCHPTTVIHDLTMIFSLCELSVLLVYHPLLCQICQILVSSPPVKLWSWTPPLSSGSEWWRRLCWTSWTCSCCMMWPRYRSLLIWSSVSVVSADVYCRQHQMKMFSSVKCQQCWNHPTHMLFFCTYPSAQHHQMKKFSLNLAPQVQYGIPNCKTHIVKIIITFLNKI